MGPQDRDDRPGGMAPAVSVMSWPTASPAVLETFAMVARPLVTSPVKGPRLGDLVAIHSVCQPGGARGVADQVVAGTGEGASPRRIRAGGSVF